MNKKYTLVTLLTLALVLIAALVSAQDSAEITDLISVNHLQAGMIEQDVFILNKDGQAVRIDNTAPISTLYQPVFTTTEAQEHDPLAIYENPFGPFEAGAELGLTLAEWLGATATGSYVVEGEESHLSIEANGLVPNGVYTVWCARFLPPPSFGFVDLPCGAEDGSENVFTASEDGSYIYELDLAPLDPAVADNMPIIALAYHSDDNTYGELPGGFGLNSHVQIFSLITPTE